MSLALVTVDRAGHQLAAPAAASYLRMLADGCPGGITSAYRSPAEQAAMRAEYLRKLAAGVTGLAYVATVEGSGHPLGTRLDLPEPARTWVRQHGAPHGWDIGVENPAEPWHARYIESSDRRAASAAGASVTSGPIPAPPRRPLMIVLIHPDRGYWLVGPSYRHRLTGEEWAEAIGPLRDQGVIAQRVYEDGPVGARRFDLAMAAYTQPTA